MSVSLKCSQTAFATCVDSRSTLSYEIDIPRACSLSAVCLSALFCGFSHAASLLCKLVKEFLNFWHTEYLSETGLMLMQLDLTPQGTGI